MPTKDSAVKWSSPMGEENTWKAAACSSAVAWQLGHTSGQRRCPTIRLRRCLPVGPSCQSSTRFKPKWST